MRFMAVFLLVVPTTLAQHSGGFARGNAGGRGFAGHGTMTRRTTPGSAGRFRSRFIGSYPRISGSFGFWGGYPGEADYYPYQGIYAEEPSPVPDAFVTAPAAGQASPQPAAPVRPAQSVIHEYKWPKNDEPGDGATTFTIALKDGSQRFAVAAWIQGGKLQYLDSEGRQQALSSDVIDRQTTERLNKEKHLRLELPPG
jgi:hypothetical protein